ncbi:MAG: hypothetical protein WCO60_17670 [Verrucomicrobiota bacterium]
MSYDPSKRIRSITPKIVPDPVISDSKFHDMSSGSQTLIEHFTSNDWNFDRDDENRIIRAGFTGENAQFRCLVLIDSDDDLIQTFVTIPNLVPATKRVEMPNYAPVPLTT